jgi:hypothetical protein
MADIPVDAREGTSFRMGPKVIPTTITAGEASEATPDTAAPTSAEAAIPLEEGAEAGPPIDPALVEEKKRQADLARLNMMSKRTRQEIASMDMMGEFGSKVSISFLQSRGMSLTNRSIS